MDYKYNILISDIETNAIANWQTLAGLDRLHCFTVIDPTNSNLYEFNTMKDNIEEGLQMLQDSEYICFHNGIGFDAPALYKLYGIKFNKIVDTMLMAKVLFPDISNTDHKRENFPRKLVGSHSLKAWGMRIGVHKDEHGESEDWENFSPEMQTYCNQDVRTTFALYKHLLAHSVSPKSLVLEHEFAKLIRVQEMNGFPFDVKKAEKLAKELMMRRVQIEQEMQEVFPPKVEQMKSVLGWKVEVDGFEYTAKTKVQLKAELKRAGLKQTIADLAEKTGNKTKTIPFNPGSRDQIAERLMEQGWKPAAYDGKRPEINETVLRNIGTKESLKLFEYLLVQKRLGMLAEGKHAWLSAVTDEGRIHGSVNTAGTISGRCSHNSPNLGQIPATRSEYGKECRELFVAPKGKVLCGSDAAQLELRCLAHFLAPYDSGKYVREILEGDIHTVNQEAAGLPTRDSAKTFIYSLIYGASNSRLGEAVGKGMKEGSRLRKSFMTKMPAFKKLISDVERAAEKNGHLTGIDGRRINVRSKHSLLNFLLQSCGAVVMKQSLIEFNQLAKHPYEMHANVHDEVQFSCLEEHAKDLGRTFVVAIEKAGKTLGMKCPLDGDFKIGNNWAETH
tara:strand:+ start:746 stop:2593 length:1848 start_codon:yes stop_codon:yes gene_type:complete